MGANRCFTPGFGLPPMTPGKNSGSSPKPSFKSPLVKFTATEADQALLLAVEQYLTTQPRANFSDLCKAALRLRLLPEAMLDMPPAAAEAGGEANLAELRQQVQQLAERLTQLEQKLAPAPAELPPELDPLLSRLAPLLEDF